MTFRQTDAEWPALWRQRRRIAQPAARWHREGQIAQYFSLYPAGAWAELIRRAPILSKDELLAWPRTLWQCWVQEHDIADLSSEERIRAIGLRPAMFYDTDYEPCQALADELRAAQYRGLLSPNAALRGVVNLTVFGDRYEILLPVASSVEDVDNADPDWWITVCRVAAPGYSPVEVLQSVRNRSWN